MELRIRQLTRNRRKVIYFIIVSLFILGSVFHVIDRNLLMNGVLGKLVYYQVAEAVARGCHDDEQKAIRVFEYVHSIIPHSRYLPYPIYYRLITGEGVCSEISGAFVILLTYLGIPARTLDLLGDDGIAHHTIAEVKIKDTWVLFDPDYKIILRNPLDNSLASYREVLSKEEIITDCYKSHDNRGELAKLYGTGHRVVGWEPSDDDILITLWRKAPLKYRKVVLELALKLYFAEVSIFGVRENLYPGGAFDQKYYKARIYHILGQHNRAVIYYRKTLLGDSSYFNQKSLEYLLSLKRQGLDNEVQL